MNPKIPPRSPNPNPAEVPKTVDVSDNSLLPATPHVEAKISDPRELMRRAALGISDTYGVPERKQSLLGHMRMFVQLHLLGEGHVEGMADEAHPPNHEYVPIAIECLLRVAPQLAVLLPLALSGVDLTMVDVVRRRLLDLKGQIRVARMWVAGLETVQANLEQFLYNTARVIHLRTQQPLQGFSLGDDMEEFRRLFTSPTDQAADTRKLTTRITEKARNATLAEVEKAASGRPDASDRGNPTDKPTPPGKIDAPPTVSSLPPSLATLLKKGP